MSGKIRVVITDDSLIARELIRKILETDDQIEIVGVAKNGKEAVEMVSALKPDIITLDLRMPVMDGFKAIEQIMAFNPTPILVITATSFKKKQEIVFEALALGALDIVVKPSPEMWVDFSRAGGELIKKLKILSGIPVVTHLQGKKKSLKKITLPGNLKGFKVIAIGASTGGPQALLRILSRFPSDFPAGIVVVQHIAAGFTERLVEWLNKSCKISVQVAKDGQKVIPGQALIAANGNHSIIDENGLVKLSKSSPVNGHRPSIDILFSSVASVYKSDTIGIILTGMGKDGVEGMKRIKRSGGKTIAQDKESCVVFGMPKVAIDNMKIDKIVTLDRIASEIINILKEEKDG
ncbi:chemotaxis-specific protein-glutamate methyltransferase CheB [bacterium]|nr:chemotaxis-specific protein-glutamate methyltransferase CheB [bacterium]